MQRTVQLGSRTSQGEVTTTELATFSRPVMVNPLDGLDSYLCAKLLLGQHGSGAEL